MQSARIALFPRFDEIYAIRNDHVLAIRKSPKPFGGICPERFPFGVRQQRNTIGNWHPQKVLRDKLGDVRQTIFHLRPGDGHVAKASLDEGLSKAGRGWNIARLKKALSRGVVDKGSHGLGDCVVVGPGFRPDAKADSASVP